MQRRITLKNHLQEIQLITRRCIIASVIMLLFIIILIIRLGYLQVMKQELYTTLSQKNWLDINALEPTRGLIFDRNGLLLAENIPVFSLDIIPYKIKNIPALLANIAKIISLSDTEIAQFHKELKQHRRFDEIPLKLRLTEAEVARFYENQYQFPGVLIKARLIRYYPLNGTLSHVLGYVGRINAEEFDELDTRNYSATKYIGKSGIEKFYEQELHGTVGHEQAEIDVSGQSIRILSQIKPVPGKNLFLTIDSQLQKMAEQALIGNRGAVVAIQPATGQILALVSEPTYDPNAFVVGISNQDFQQLQKSPNKPLYNRVLRGLYPMASPIKPFIALEGLDSGIVNTHYTIQDPGWYQLPNSSHRFYDWKPHGHGSVNLVDAIIHSCDTYFFDLGHRMGIHRIDSILNRFGFGQLTGIDMNEEISGVVASPAWKRKAKGAPWYEGDTINSAIGQGFMQATPLQLAYGTATIANRGKRLTPHLLLYTKTSEEKIEPYSAKDQDPVVLENESSWDTVIHAMQSVASSPNGTGYRLGKNFPFTVAAKTGTAQVYSIKHRNKNNQAEKQENLPENLRDHALLVAFAPVTDPEIAIAVVVENNNKQIALIIARKVLDDYFARSPRIHNLMAEKGGYTDATH